MTVEGRQTVHAREVTEDELAFYRENGWDYPAADITLYFPSDAKYSGRAFHGLDELGLIPGEPFDHPNFPLVYPD